MLLALVQVVLVLVEAKVLVLVLVVLLEAKGSACLMVFVLEAKGNACLMVLGSAVGKCSISTSLCGWPAVCLFAHQVNRACIKKKQLATRDNQQHTML